MYAIILITDKYFNPNYFNFSRIENRHYIAQTAETEMPIKRAIPAKIFIRISCPPAKAIT